MRQITGEVMQGGSPFPPIADYAFLSDCETCALVAPSGNIEWMCLPRFDGASVFGAMLDREAGGFLLAPLDHKVPNGRRYVPGTNILETTWGTKTGWIIVRDVLLVGPWRHTQDRSKTHRRSPTDYDAEHVLLRTMRCVNGTVEMHLECEPVLGYGTQQVTWDYTDTGYNAGRATSDGSDVEIVLTTDLNLGFEASRARARRTMRDGDTAYCALTWNDAQPPQDYDEAYRRLVRTADYWHEWLAHGDFPDHPWRPYLQRSALTLKGLSYAPTGAMVAAATTSLPETPRGERNWDYRYSWVRDSAFMLNALLGLSCAPEARAYFWWLMHASQLTHPRLRVLYRLDGGARAPERELALDGYRGSRPVRVGNAAAGQRQLDTYGELMQTAWLYARGGHRIDRDIAHRLAEVADLVCELWREPDAGIWEVRSEQRHFTQSKMMCWIALDRACELAGRGLIPARHAERWRAQADAITEFVETRCYSADNRSYVRAADSDELDASLLLGVLFAYGDPRGGRWAGTIEALRRELTTGPFVRRYTGEDGLEGAEGAFLTCSFWLAEALARTGHLDDAVGLMDELIDLANDVGLYAEEIEPATGAFLGNMPQGLSHLALISAALAIVSEAER